MLSLDAMRVFTALVEEGSFTAAAARLGVTQSGVSQGIARLERDLGVRLVERSSRGASATPAGRRLHARCIAVLRDVSSIEAEVSALAGGSAGTARIGLMPALTRSLAGPVLRAYLADNPNASVNLVERNAADLIEEVAANRLHGAVVPAFDAPEAMRCRSLGRTPEVLVTRADAGGAHMTPAVLRELPPLRLVLQSGGHIRRRRVIAQLRSHGATIEAMMDLDSMFATLEHVTHSDYATVLPAIMMAPEIASGTLCVRPVAGAPLILDLMLISPARREPSPMVDELASRLEASVADFNAAFTERSARSA